MAAIDNETVPLTLHGASFITIEDGTTPTAFSVSVKAEASLTWSQQGNGKSATESRHRDQHHAGGAVVVQTGDNNVTVNLEFDVSSYLGSSVVSLYEFMTFTGGAAAYLSVGTGNAKRFKMTVTFLSPDATGATQTVTFAECRLDTWDNDPTGGGTDGGLMRASVTITDFENLPAIA